MDVDRLIHRIDIKAEHDEFRKKYEYKKKEFKRKEIKKIFSDFKAYFKESGEFKFKDNEHSITAIYRDHTIKLDMDIYKNLDNDAFELHGYIKMFDKSTYNFTARAVYKAELPMHTDFDDAQKKMEEDTLFYKDFIQDDFKCSFTYTIEGREEEFKNMQELLVAL